MSNPSSLTLPREQFLTMAGNLLYQAFLDSSRTAAKNAYKEMAAGKTVQLKTVQMEDESLVRFDVALDYSEYKGTLNFGAFRASLTLLISSLGESLKSESEIKVFSAEHDPNVMIFGVTAVTRESQDPNVMVLGANMAGQKPSVVLNLMYLDHEQFTLEADEVAG